MTDTGAWFGDLDADDVWDETATIAPEQVAYKVHALRRALEQLAGRDLPAFDDLSRRDRDLANDVGVALTDYAVMYGTGNAERAAEVVHDVLRAMAGAPTWAELDDDARAIAVALVALVFSWLRRQGPR